MIPILGMQAAPANKLITRDILTSKVNICAAEGGTEMADDTELTSVQQMARNKIINSNIFQLLQQNRLTLR